MPNDAKFGVALGLTMVIAVAVIFFHKDEPTPPAQSVPPARAIAKPEPTPTPRPQLTVQPAIRSREIQD